MHISKKELALTLGVAGAAVANCVPLMAFAQEGSNDVAVGLLIPKPAEFIPMLIAFLVIWVVMAKFAWPQIAGMLDKRAETIRESLTEAERIKIEAQQTLDEYKAQLASARQESSEIIANAKRSGEALKVELAAKAQAEAENIVSKARQSIELEKRQAMTELQSTIAELSVGVAGKIISEDLSDEAHRSLIERYITEVGTSHAQ